MNDSVLHMRLRQLILAAVVSVVGAQAAFTQSATGPNASQGSSAKIPRCDKPLGVMAVVEPQDAIQSALAKFRLGSPSGVLRMIIQQSNCFLVADRGMAMQNLMQERQLAGDGQLRQGSNVGGGQLVAADYLLTPEVVFSEGNAGGGGFLGVAARAVNPLAGIVAGALKFKEAQTTLIVTDARSGIQVASADGKAKKTDFALGGLGIGANSAGALGAYTNTNEGKVIVASFVDNFARIVEVVRNDSSLQRASRTAAQEAAAPAPPAVNSLQEGDVLVPKIAGVRVMFLPRDSARVVATIGKADEVVFLGKEQDGYVQVQTSAAMGWVKKLMVARKQP